MLYVRTSNSPIVFKRVNVGESFTNKKDMPNHLARRVSRLLINEKSGLFYISN